MAGIGDEIRNMGMEFKEYADRSSEAAYEVCRAMILVTVVVHERVSDIKQISDAVLDIALEHTKDNAMRLMDEPSCFLHELVLFVRDETEKALEVNK